MTKESMGQSARMSERRLTIYLATEDVQAIDEYRQSHGLPSRSRAVAALVQRGLAVPDRSTTPNDR